MAHLYLISPPVIDLPAFTEALNEALGVGEVPAFQLRLKEASDDDILKAAKALLPVCHRHGTLFLMNDRMDLAKASGADGVHLGQDDGRVKKARQLLGSEALIGVSCQDSRHKAMVAAEDGADYVSFGAFFPTVNKETTARPEREILTWWSQWTTVPCAAIGGITADNAGEIAKAGVDFICVISGVWHYPAGPAAGVKALCETIAESGQTR